MSFAPASVARYRPAEGDRPARLAQHIFGLLGPNGPLPLHLTDYARERQLHHGDLSLSRFLDLFHHRMLALFYRAWAQAQPTVSLDRPAKDRFADHVGALLGIGTPRLRGRDVVGDFAKLYNVGWFSRQVRNADGLAAVLSGYFRQPLRIEQFVGHWMRLPESDRTRLGSQSAGAQLGVGAVLGSRVWDRQHKFRVHVGPLGLRDYEAFLPGGCALPRLIALVRQYLCFELDWDARLILRRDEVPETRLGRAGRLGWTTWLGKPRGLGDPAPLTLDAERVHSRYEAASATL